MSLPSANPAALASEVRTCPGCQQASVVLVSNWRHTSFGASTGQSTRDYRCQSCGAKYTIHAKANIWGYWIVGGLLTLTTCVMGLPFLFLAWRRSSMEERLPVFPGAPMPALRYRAGPPLRACGSCGTGTASAISIVRSTHNGIPTGTEYTYRCSACAKEFVLESPLGQILTLVGAAALGAGAAAMFMTAKHPGWKFGGSIVLALLTLLLFVQAASRFLARFRNPVNDSLPS